MTDAQTLPLPEFLQLEDATEQDIAQRILAQGGVFGIEPGMTAAGFEALGVSESAHGPEHRLDVTLEDETVSLVEYQYLGYRRVGEAIRAALRQRHGEPKAAGKRWDTDGGRYVLESKYRDGPGYWDVTLELSPAPAKKKGATRRAKPKPADTAASLAAALTSHLHDIQGDVYDDGAIDRVAVRPEGSGWRVDVIAEGTGGSASFTWSQPVRDADGRLDEELLDAVVDAGGSAIAE